MQRQSVWVVISLAAGLLQAWDSGGLSSGLFVSLVTIVGIVLPGAAIGMRVPYEVRIGALVVGALLLVAARVVAPGSLNGLHLALFPAAVYILFLRGVVANGQQQSA